jgi:hypothetical protein
MGSNPIQNATFVGASSIGGRLIVTEQGPTQWGCEPDDQDARGAGLAMKYLHRTVSDATVFEAVGCRFESCAPCQAYKSE